MTDVLADDAPATGRRRDQLRDPRALVAWLRRSLVLVSALAEDDGRRQARLAQPLRCWRARRHVSAYLDDELGLQDRAAVEEHLAGCPTCPPLYASLVGVRASLGGLRDPDTVVEAAMAAGIMVRLAAEPGHRQGDRS